MNKLIAQRYVIKQNLPAIIGFCLCFYFLYHGFLGDRSYFRLLSLERQSASVALVHHDLRQQREALEQRVVNMRPGSLNRDMLDQQARAMLGYAAPHEKIVMQ